MVNWFGKKNISPQRNDTSKADEVYLNEEHKKNLQTSLHIVAACNDLSVARELISKGANVNAQNIWGGTPLHLAVGNRNLEMVKLLVSNGADPTIKNTNGETAQLMARLSGDIQLIIAVANKM